MAMENGPVEDVFPIENGWFSIAMLVYWRVGINFLIYKQPVYPPVIHVFFMDGTLEDEFQLSPYRVPFPGLLVRKGAS